MTGMTDNPHPPRRRQKSADEIARFRATSHIVDAERFEWLSSKLEARRDFAAAQRAQEWSRHHERLACDLLGIQARPR